MSVGAGVADLGRRLFVAPRPAWPLAFARIGIGIVVLAWALTLLVDVEVFIGAGAIVPPESADPTFRVLPIESTAAGITALLALVAASVAIVIGFRPTVFLLAAFVLIVGLQRRNPDILNSGDLIMRDLTLLLAMCPTGAALSVDRVRRFGRDALFHAPDVAPWGMRLVQLQMIVVYFFAFWSKSGATWRDGTAVSTALRLIDLQRFGQIDLLVDSVTVVAVLTWGTLLVEIVLASLLWVRRLRPVLIIVAIVLHVSIDSLMLVGFFGPAMIAGLMTFVDGDAVESRMAERRRRSPHDGDDAQPESLGIDAEADLGTATG